MRAGGKGQSTIALPKSTRPMG